MNVSWFVARLALSRRLALGTALCLLGPNQVMSEEFTFRVYRLDGMKFSRQQADRILDESTRLFERSNCDVVLSRCGELRTYGNHDGVVDSSTKFAALRPPAPGSSLREAAELTHIHVKIVREISWCRGRFMPPTTTLGCTEIDNNWMVVRQPERDSPDAVVWSHEFAHSRGVDHVQNPTDPNLLMIEYVTEKNTHIMPAQCEKIRNSPLGSGPFTPAKN